MLKYLWSIQDLWSIHVFVEYWYKLLQRSWQYLFDASIQLHDFQPLFENNLENQCWQFVIN